MDQPSTAQVKTCSKCGETKPLQEFHKRTGAKDGRRAHCGTCASSAQRARYDPQKQKEYEASRRENRLIYSRSRYAKNKDLFAERWKKYYEKNKKQLIAKNKGYRREYQRRLRKDPKYRLIQSMRSRINKMIVSKTGSMRYLAYTSADLMSHLERQFTKEMTWDNYGSYWHVDHILPVSMFDIDNADDFMSCWDLTNLRPLQAKKNMSKGARQEFLI